MSKDASYETATAVQEKVLDAIKVGQEATLTAVREAADAFTTTLPKLPEWAEAFTKAMPKMPEWAEAYTPKLPNLSVLPSFEGLIGFSEKIWEGQREFNLKLYEAIAPIGRTAFGAAKDTAKTAKTAADQTKTAGDHAKPTAEHTTTRTTAAKA